MGFYGENIEEIVKRLVKEDNLSTGQAVSKAAREFPEEHMDYIERCARREDDPLG